jgi:formylglycine-generating enzyme required for sulfatase activity
LNWDLIARFGGKTHPNMTTTDSAIRSYIPWRLLLPALLALPCAAPAAPVFVHVGDPGNPPCPINGRGAVPYEFEMGAFEVSNQQYAEFLNAVAAEADPFALYNPNMDMGLFGGIRRVEQEGLYRYAALEGFERLPVVYVSWYDAARFCNWLHFGSPATGRSELGTTEGTADEGAYDTRSPAFARNPGARYALPTHDEWVKAGFYERSKKNNGGYWLYPVRSDAKPASTSPPGSASSVNYFDGHWAAPMPYLTPVGAYVNASSPYGTFDQGGNVMEWVESPAGRDRRGIVGGDATKFNYALRIDYNDAELPDQELYIVGFRVVRLDIVNAPR